MKARTAPADRRLPDDQRARLRVLLDALPANPSASDPDVKRLISFGLSLKGVPWYAPTCGAGLDYMIRLYALDVAIDALKQLSLCDDWGPGPGQGFTGSDG